MIVIDNFKIVLEKIGFLKDPIGEFYRLDYETCTMAVDIVNQKLIYPEDKGLIVNDKTTSNFSHPENFVVFECVCRLLKKGYRPEHIELEPRWHLGHDAKGGKADILVRDKDGKTLLIIECKTAGGEFTREKKNTEDDGGQLFSYWQQEGSTRWLSLYASDYLNGDITYKSLSINCTDDANIVKIAEKDSDVRIYNNAKNDRERFEVWRDTYGRQWLDDVIFCAESQAYNIGIPPLTKGKLRDFSPEDRIVNRFEEILRHNNVSDKENAFNRLVALFICKLVDEIKKTELDIVDFQYKQGADTYESLQDRLQKLHQQGMEEFMKEKIFYVDADYAERLFMQYTGRQRKAAVEDLKRTIRILKFYSNNDFAFKDVHNEELFFQNGKILVEVVQLFQPYRIVYPSKHQFLGDLFEQLLNKGFKQNEGQFFTPTPITRFIWDSLPLQDYIINRDIPRIIDFACGAGHFLTEAVEAVNAVRKDADNSWVEKHVYGVEKDYRLARVSKISMFMNGAGGANIIFGDGLENYAEKGITNGSFDILVANPPYSVSGFKQHLKLKNNSFDIIDKITPDGSEIETLFVERTAQLLKPKGIAAVILPASILTNSSGSYIAAREELLKNFMIRAIVNFGSKTFGATGTNTVVLFLERFDEPPRISEMAKDVVDGIINNTDRSEWQDGEIMEEYLAHQGIGEDSYKQFLARSMRWEELEQDPYFKSYTESVPASSIKYPKNATDEQKSELRLNKFYEYALGVERDKLYYFTLVHNQKTIVITAPTDNAEQKAFLGYDWSNRKGAEGIIITKKGGQLYNDEDRFKAGTLAFLIRSSFWDGVEIILPEKIKKYAQTYRLRDMIDYSRVQFDKAIKLSVTKDRRISLVYRSIPLGEVASYISEKVLYSEITPESYISTDNMLQNKAGVCEYNGVPTIERVTKYQKGDILVSNIRPYLKKIWCATRDGGCSNDVIVFRNKSEEVCLTDYLFQILSMDEFFEFMMANKSGMKMPRGDKRLIPAFSIPLPPIAVQQKIVDECRKVDEECKANQLIIEDYRHKIVETFSVFDVKKLGGVPISDVCELLVGGDKPNVFSDIKTRECSVPVFSNGSDNNGLFGYTDKARITDECVTVSARGTIGYSSVHTAPFYPIVRLIVAIPKKEMLLSKFLKYSLDQMHFYNTGGTIPQLTAPNLGKCKIYLPSLPEQQRVISEIEVYEAQIQSAEAVMATRDSRKQAILDKYLK